MIHYKKSYLGEGTALPEFKLGGSDVSSFFVKNNMRKVIDGHVRLANMIAESLGLIINEDIGAFAADGKNGLVNYVYDGAMGELG